MRFGKMTCFPVSTHVSFSIYTLELETKSSVAVTSTFTLFLNAQLTFSPVSYPYCVLRCLLLSIQYPNVEEIYINVLVLFILKITKYFTKWSKLQHSIQQSTIDNQTRFYEKSPEPNNDRTLNKHCSCSFIGRDDKTKSLH